MSTAPDTPSFSASRSVARSIRREIAQAGRRPIQNASSAQPNPSERSERNGTSVNPNQASAIFSGSPRFRCAISWTSTASTSSRLSRSSRRSVSITT